MQGHCCSCMKLGISPCTVLTQTLRIELHYDTNTNASGGLSLEAGSSAEFRRKRAFRLSSIVLVSSQRLFAFTIIIAKQNLAPVIMCTKQ